MKIRKFGLIACLVISNSILAMEKAIDETKNLSIDDSEAILKNLQKNKEIPCFLLTDSEVPLDHDLKAVPLRKFYIYSDTDSSIQLNLLLGKNLFRLGAVSMPNDKLLDIDTLASVYALAIGYNNKEGLDLVNSWQNWSSKTPRTFVNLVQQYLMRKDVRNDCEDFINSSAKNVVNEDYPSSMTLPALDLSLLNRYMAICTTLIGQEKLHEQDTLFITTMAKFFLKASVCHCPCYEGRYGSVAKELTIQTLNKLENGKKILDALKEDSDLKFTIEYYQKK